MLPISKLEIFVFSSDFPTRWIFLWRIMCVSCSFFTKNSTFKHDFEDFYSNVTSLLGLTYSVFLRPQHIHHFSIDLIYTWFCSYIQKKFHIKHVYNYLKYNTLGLNLFHVSMATTNL